MLLPNENIGQLNATASSTFASFNSNGFTVGANSGYNGSSDEMCSWTFRKCPGFFDVVTYTGNGSSSGQTISHSLGSTPGSIWIKRTNAAEDWCVYHRSIGTAGHVRLNTTSNYTTNQKFANVTSTSFNVYDNDAMINGSGDTYVAYIFAHDDRSFGDSGNEAIIKCGSYTGSGSTGKTVSLGFEPQFIIVKSTDQTRPWVIIDNMRGMPRDGDGVRLLANDNAGEVSNASFLAPTPTGFEVTQQNTYVNVSGEDYIYMAIRRPHKPPSAGTDVLAIDPYSGSSTLPFEASFAPDLAFIKHLTSASSWFWSDPRGDKAVNSNYANAEAQNSAYGVQFRGAFSQSWTGYIGYMLKRAPGFFDVVAYTGTGLLSSIDHSLGVVPEIIFVKRRSANDSWAVYHKALGSSNELWLDQDYASMSNALFGGIDPVATAFYAKADNQINGNGQTYVAYLFATMAGISKVGSYSGSGTTHNIDCGFTNGARFVLIKRTDSAADAGICLIQRKVLTAVTNLFPPKFDLRSDYWRQFCRSVKLGFQLVTGDHVVNGVGASYIFLAIA